MLKSYLITAVRSLTRNKVLSFINTSGLAIGIAACLLASFYMYEEFTYDTFHDEHERIYRVVLDAYEDEGAFASTPLPVGPALQEDFSEIKSMTRFQKMDNFLVRNDDNIFFEQMTVVDSGFFDVFSFNLLKGNPATALTQPNQIVLTESSAKKYFGDEDPIGKTLLVGTSGRYNSVVTGVVADAPGNSQLQFDFLLSFATIQKAGIPVTLWFQMPMNYTYVRLTGQASVQRLTSLLPDFIKKHLGDRLKGPYETNYNLALQPLTDVHLGDNRKMQLPTHGNRLSLYLFASVSVVILLIACINYVNLTSARFIRRAKEVSVRKIVGARRVQLIFQLLSESIVLGVMAGIVALVLVALALPSFNELANTRIDLATKVTPLWIGVWCTLVCVPAVGGGIFPAIFLAGTDLVRSLKSSVGLSPAGIAVRKALVVFQLIAAVFLVTAALAEFRQMDFIRSSLYHHDGDQVMIFSINQRIARSFDVLRNELGEYPAIKGVTASSSVPGQIDRWTVRRSPEDSPMVTENFVVDDQYIQVMGYELVEGRNFDRTKSSDSAAFIINEKAVRELGFGDPEKALGETIYWSEETPPKKGIIIGVLKDFNYSTYRDEIQPALLQLNVVGWNQYASIRLEMDDFQNTIETIRETVKSVDPIWLMDYTFLDDNFEKLHQRDAAQSKIFGISSIVAIFISCLGLLGLVMFTASQRSREMGIRKVLGAGNWQVGFMIARTFIYLFGIAYLVALPLSLYAMREWLSGFAYRIDLSAGIFFMSAMLILGSVVLAIGHQTFKLSRVNPADVLKAD